MARTVEDAALFLDVTTTMPAPDGGFVAAAGRATGTVTDCFEHQAAAPAGGTRRRGRSGRRSKKRVNCCVSSAMTSIERDPDYPATAIVGQALPRYFRGAYDDVRTLPHPERLEAGRVASPALVACSRTGGWPKSVQRKAKSSDGSSRSSTTSTWSITPGHRDGTVAHRRVPTAGRHIDAATGDRARAFPGGVQRDGAAGGGRAVGIRR